MYCRICRYNLRSLEGPACPECGRAFDPDDPSSYDSVPSWRRACTATLVLGFVPVLALQVLLFNQALDVPGLVVSGDWIALIGASLLA